MLYSLTVSTMCFSFKQMKQLNINTLYYSKLAFFPFYALMVKIKDIKIILLKQIEFAILMIINISSHQAFHSLSEILIGFYLHASENILRTWEAKSSITMQLHSEKRVLNTT